MLHSLRKACRETHTVRSPCGWGETNLLILPDHSQNETEVHPPPTCTPCSLMTVRAV